MGPIGTLVSVLSDPPGRLWSAVGTLNKIVVAADWNDMFGKGRRTPRVRAKDIALPAAADEHPFSIVKGGYAVAEVAAFVASMSADMTTLTPQDLRRASFTIERRGYDKAEVFAYLNRVAAEIEAELDIARQQARRERIVANDPTLAAVVDVDTVSSTPVSDAVETGSEPAPTPAPDIEPEIEIMAPPRSASPPVEVAPTTVEASDPSPSPIESGMAPGTEIIYFDAPDGGEQPSLGADAIPGREILWLTEDEVAASANAAAPPDAVVEPEPTPPEPEPVPVNEPVPVSGPLPPPPPPPAPNPIEAVTSSPGADAPGGPTVAEATSEIGDLLRAAHDMAVRLRANAEADVKATVESARIEIEDRTRAQHRELDDAKAAAERRHAELVHNAQLTANETRAAAELDAARTRAAADAVMAQARAEVEAVKALARHNLAEIEMARDQAIADASEMLGLGKSMLLSINDLDRDLAARVVRTQQLLGQAQQALSPETS